MPDAIAHQARITPALVLRAFRRIPLPHPRTHIQPAGETLVNFDTIFYTDAGSLTRDLTLLGQPVHLDITPTGYRWVNGDGTITTTTTPGTPYPAKTITHRYQHAHTTVTAHVEVTWTARYRVGGGPSTMVPGTVTTVGPPTRLHISEAIPALSGRGH